MSSCNTNSGEGDDSDNEVDNYWERPGWFPRTASGRQRTPDSIRLEFQKYIDASSETQTAILQRIGINSNSFRKFMDPSTYKSAWSATSNGTYMAAARLLEEERHRKKSSPKPSRKRKKATPAPAAAAAAAADPDPAPSAGAARVSSNDNSNPNDPLEAKLAKLIAQNAAQELILKIMRVDCDAKLHVVYDSCPELVKKVQDFLQRDGVKKSMICDATGLQSSQITKFVTSKNQDACTTIAYPKLWRFFEQLRIVEGRPKSAERIQNERNHPNGFGLTKQAAAAAKPATVPSRCASGGGNDDVVDDDETDDEYFGLGPSPSKKSKKDLREEASKLMSRIALVNCDADPNVVYDSCPQIVKKVKAFLERDGITKSSLCEALGLQPVQLNKFLISKNQDGCGTVAYPRLYIFFEKLRLLEGKSKSAARRDNEIEHPNGFSLTRPRKYFRQDPILGPYGDYSNVGRRASGGTASAATGGGRRGRPRRNDAIRDFLFF